MSDVLKIWRRLSFVCFVVQHESVLPLSNTSAGSYCDWFLEMGELISIRSTAPDIHTVKQMEAYGEEMEKKRCGLLELTIWAIGERDNSQMETHKLQFSTNFCGSAWGLHFHQISTLSKHTSHLYAKYKENACLLLYILLKYTLNRLLCF